MLEFMSETAFFTGEGGEQVSTLNARANQAWAEYAEQNAAVMPEFTQEAFEEGWETGYKTRSMEIAERLEDMAGAVALGELRDLLHVFAREVRGGVS